MVDVSDEYPPRNLLFLEVAFQAERLVALVEHALIHRAVRRMANDAAFAHRFVLINKRSALRGVTLHASIVHAHEGEAATDNGLLQAGPAAFDGLAFMRVMAIGATHLAFQNGMVMRQLKLCAQGGVTLETCCRVLARIDDRTAPAPFRDMDASRTVTRFTANVLGVVALRQQPCVRRRFEIACLIFMTSGASIAADELRARDHGRRDNRARRAAGEKNERASCRAAGNPRQQRAVGVKRAKVKEAPHVQTFSKTTFHATTHFFGKIHMLDFTSIAEPFRRSAPSPHC